jgi:hypothetical protein
MHFAPMFHALVDLYTPTLDTPYVVDARVAPIAAFFTASLAIRRGLPPPPNGRPFESTLFTALESAEGGDDRRLLEALARPYASWQPMDLVAVLPRIRPPHAALVRELRWGRGQMDLSVKFPSTTLLHAVARRTIFELAGDHDEAERWAAIARRFDHALRDRRVLVALTLFD